MSLLGQFIHTRDLDLAISPSDAVSIIDLVSIEIFPSFQIAIAGEQQQTFNVFSPV
jgi:hypothetical protein